LKSASQYIEHLLEIAAHAENPAYRRMMAQCIEAIDRGALATYEREAGELTPTELASVLRQLADHVQQQVTGAVGEEWADRFRQDARDLEAHGVSDTGG
jgi:hypothetical protein